MNYLQILLRFRLKCSSNVNNNHYFNVNIQESFLFNFVAELKTVLQQEYYKLTEIHKIQELSKRT